MKSIFGMRTSTGLPATSPPIAACFFLLFFPLVSSQWGLFVWLVVFTNVARTLMSFYLVPHNTLGAEISEDIDDRTGLVAYRGFFGNIGSLFAVLTFFLFFSPLMGDGVGRFIPGAYEPWALLCALVMAVTLLWCAWGNTLFSRALHCRRTWFALVRISRRLCKTVTSTICSRLLCSFSCFNTLSRFPMLKA
jgi:Na+/melibiose symporter-like transporter